MLLNHISIAKEISTKQLHRISQFLKFETINETHIFEQSFDFLQLQFPKTFQYLELTKFGNSFLLKWQGQKSSSKNFLFSLHQDVVSANPKNWSVPPFEGVISNHKIFGRGAIDSKSSLLAILESIESLLNVGFQPQATLYFAFGADEETGGFYGARKIAKFLQDQNIRLHAVFDEGGGIIKNSLPFGVKNFALIGITERSIWKMSIELTLQNQGHSVFDTTSSIKISEMLHQIESVEFPYHSDLIDIIFKQSDLPQQTNQILAKLGSYHYLTKPMLTSSVSVQSFYANKETQKVKASLIVRGFPNTAPIQISQQIKQHLQQSFQIQHDDISVTNHLEIFRLTPDFQEQAQKIKKQNIFNKFQTAIEKNFEGSSKVVAWITPAATDSRYYIGMSEAVYRFIPLYLTQDRLSQIHGIDENISITDYQQMLNFYSDFISLISS